MAWRNNTFSLHVHVGVRGADRAVLVCDRLRPVLPLLLAISANSPFLDGRDSGLHSARTQIFTKSFPRCGVPDAFGGWQAFADYIDFLVRTRSIVEYTQVWWSIRPHFSFGTVEVRICDAQMTATESEALAALIVACVAQAARDLDEGVPFADLPRRLIEENVWRAIRYGLDGELLDLERAEPYPAAEARRPAAELDGAGPRPSSGSRSRCPSLNGAQRQRRMTDAGMSLSEAYAAVVAETRDTYAASTAEVTAEVSSRSSPEQRPDRPRRSCGRPTRRSSSGSGSSTCCSTTSWRSSTSACAAPASPRAPRTSAIRSRSGWRSSRSAR